jgi:hypothetical protein
MDGYKIFLLGNFLENFLKDRNRIGVGNVQEKIDKLSIMSNLDSLVIPTFIGLSSLQILHFG